MRIKIIGLVVSIGLLCGQSVFAAPMNSNHKDIVIADQEDPSNPPSLHHVKHHHKMKNDKTRNRHQKMHTRRHPQSQSVEQTRVHRAQRISYEQSDAPYSRKTQYSNTEYRNIANEIERDRH